MNDVNYNVELIEWRDATPGPSIQWEERDYSYHLSTAYTIGFLVAEDNESVTVCQSLCYDDPRDNPNSYKEEVRDCFLKIPKAIIVTRKVLNGP